MKKSLIIGTVIILVIAAGIIIFTITTETSGIDYSITFDGEPKDDPREIKFLNNFWKEKVDAALEPTNCVEIPKTDLPESYYQGPLIDTHLHIPQLDDNTGGEKDEDYVEPRGKDSEFYDTIPEDQVPRLGTNIKIDEIACMLQQEGSIKAFAFFPVFPETPVPTTEVARRTMERYPDLFAPFIMASASQVSTVEGDILQKMIDLQPGLFDGFGEVGDSPTEPINPLADDPIYLGDFQVAKENNLMVYFHPPEGDNENLARALELYPDVTFIVHADGIESVIDDLMNRYPNIYYTVNNFFEEYIPLFRFGEKQEFIDVIENNWDRLIKQDLERFQGLIETHPDRLMWGTDRVDIVWNYDADVGQLFTRYSRDFIGKLDPTVQEKFAYKNAQRLTEQHANN